MQGTQSICRAIELVRVLSTHTLSGWRLTDLTQETGLDHTTVHRLLKCLEQERMVTRCPGTRRYTIGPLAYELGLAARPYFSIDAHMGSSLSELASRTHTIVFLNVRSNYDSVCVARYDGHKAPKAYTVDVGTRRPLCLSAGGVAMWLSLPKGMREQVQAHNLRSIERNGQARQAAVRNMLYKSSKLGYGLNHSDIIPGITALGVPILNRAGVPIASLSLASEDMKSLDRNRASLLEQLQHEAGIVAESLDLLRY